MRHPSLLLVFTVTLAGSLPAQRHATDAGAVIVGGTGGLTRERDVGNNRRWTRFNLHPQVGLFVLDGLAVTGDVHFETIRGSQDHVTTWGAGPGLAYYFSKLSRRITPYVFGRVLLEWNKASFRDPQTGQWSSSTSSDDRTWQGGLGGAWFVARNVAVVGELFYAWSRFTQNGCTPSDCVNHGEDYGLRFGVRAFAY